MKFNWNIRLSASKQLGNILLWGVCLIMVQSCSKELDAPTPLPFEITDITASADKVVINPSKPSEDALTVSWPAFSNSMISYKIILANGEQRDSVAVASGAISKRFTQGELNAILVEKLKMTVNVESKLDITVLGLIPSKTLSTTSKTISIQVVPGPVGAAYASLWVVGDATPNGWNIENPNAMKKDPTNAFQFKFNEVLNAGDFKIPVATGNWGTDFFMPLANHPKLSETGVQLVPGGNPDYKWNIATAGVYKILLNISATPFITIKPFTPYKQIWLVGDAVPSGWTIDNPTPMVPTAGNPYEFTYTGSLKVGEFKIPTATGSWDGDFFMPPTNGEGTTGKDAIIIAEGKIDNKWKITEAGTYKITFNQLYETISIVKN